MGSDSDDSRARLFWTVCIPLRVAIAIVALVLGAVGEWTWLAVHGWIALAQLVGFAVAALRDPARGMLGGVVWWRGTRLGHVAVYVAFVVAALQRQWWAGFFLVVDVVVGVAAWFLLRPSYHQATEVVDRALPVLAMRSSGGGDGR